MYKFRIELGDSKPRRIYQNALFKYKTDVNVTHRALDVISNFHELLMWNIESVLLQEHNFFPNRVNKKNDVS